MVQSPQKPSHNFPFLHSLGKRICLMQSQLWRVMYEKNIKTVLVNFFHPNMDNLSMWSSLLKTASSPSILPPFSESKLSLEHFKSLCFMLLQHFHGKPQPIIIFAMPAGKSKLEVSEVQHFCNIAFRFITLYGYFQTKWKSTPPLLVLYSENPSPTFSPLNPTDSPAHLFYLLFRWRKACCSLESGNGPMGRPILSWDRNTA